MIAIGILGLAIALLCGELAAMYLQLLHTKEVLSVVQAEKKREGRTQKHAAPDWDRIMKDIELEKRGRKKA